MHRGIFFSQFSLRILCVKVLMPMFLITLLALAGSFSDLVEAQTSGPNSEDRKIDARMQLEIIDSVTQVLNEMYVFPEVAERMEKHLRKQYKEKKYRDITSLVEFAEKLTGDLYDVSQDKHLLVAFVSDEFFKQLEADTLTDEAKQEELQAEKYISFGFNKLERLAGNVGYLDLREFSTPELGGRTAVAAMNFLAHSDAIIIDLRYPYRGGSPTMVELIMSYFFDETVQFTSIYNRPEDLLIQSWSMDYLPGPRMAHIPLYVLTSNRTFSACEAFAYDLKHLGRATIIGEATRGGAHVVDRHGFPNLNIGMQIPFGRAINPVTGTNWEGIGVEPDVQVPVEQALDVAHLDALEKLSEKTEDTDRKAQLQWAIDGKKTVLNPVAVEVIKLQAYVGGYGPRKIWIENDQLYYQREERPKYRLIPMGEDRFMLQGMDNFRIQFVHDSAGTVVELVGLYEGGYRDSNKRDGK